MRLLLMSLLAASLCMLLQPALTLLLLVSDCIQLQYHQESTLPHQLQTRVTGHKPHSLMDCGVMLHPITVYVDVMQSHVVLHDSLFPFPRYVHSVMPLCDCRSKLVLAPGLCCSCKVMPT